MDTKVSDTISALPIFNGLDTITGCDAAADERFVAWCLDRGVRFPKLVYPYFDPITGVRGIGAREKIGRGETLIEVPEDLLITAPVVCCDPEYGHVFTECSDLFGLDEDVIVAVYMCLHLLKGEASPLAPWIAVIPKVIESTANWTTEDLNELQDESFKAISTERDAQLKASTQRLVDSLRSRYPAVFDERFTSDLVRWGLQTVSARAYGRRLPDAAMVPMADVFNHSNVAVKYGLAAYRDVPLPEDAHTEPSRAHPESEMCGTLFGSSMARVSDDDRPDATGTQRFFRLWNSGYHVYMPGQEVHNSYGRRDNRHLALEYGFAVLDNNCDGVECRPGGVMDIAPPPMLIIPSKIRNIMVRQNLAIPQFTALWNIFAADALPYFRALHLSAAEIALIESSKTMTLHRPISTFNELEALRHLREYYTTALQGHETSIEEDEELLNAPRSYRHLVAISYRLTRKRILRQQIDWVSATERVVELEWQRLQRITSTAAPMRSIQCSVVDYMNSLKSTFAIDIALSAGVDRSDPAAPVLLEGFVKRISTTTAEGDALLEEVKRRHKASTAGTSTEKKKSTDGSKTKKRK